jgi:hypothetical protein
VRGAALHPPPPPNEGVRARGADGREYPPEERAACAAASVVPARNATAAGGAGAKTGAANSNKARR